MIEYFNDWAFVQCAVRGVGFCPAVKVTMAFFAAANLPCILSDLLLDSLTTCGGLLAGMAGAASGTLAGFLLHGKSAALWGAGLGFPLGFLAGIAALGVLSSGVKTLLTCWAEDPQTLADRKPDIHQEFQQRLDAYA